MRALFLLLCLSPLAAAGDASTELAAAQRSAILNEGYSQLYDVVSGLRWLDEALIFKFESEPTERFVAELAEYAAELRKDLGRLSADYPALTLEDDGLPALEKAAREAIRKDGFDQLKPVTGMTGMEFERTLLLTQSAVLNRLRHLARVTAQAESNPQRRKVLVQAQRRFDRLYRDVSALLERSYFCQPQL